MTASRTPPAARTTALRAVYFDCDSTLATIEGIDELLGHMTPAARTEILALTQQAMDGTLPLAEVYDTRLRHIAPTAAMLEQVGQQYIDNRVADVDDVVRALRHVGLHVGIISGGLLPPVRALGRHLGIPDGNIHAVPLHFDDGGNFVDFDRQSPLWQNGGKVQVIDSLPQEHRPLAFVGDGITDLETQPVVECFIGFGGVVTREPVRRGARRWVDGPGLAPVLRHCLTETQRQALSATAEFAPLLAKAFPQ